MATQSGIKATLRTLAANHNRHREWVTDNAPLWYKGLIHYTDQQLAIAVSEWSVKKNKVPTLADMLVFLKNQKGATGLQAPDGCPHCDRTGWRELARHYLTDKGEPCVTNCVAPCDCELGNVFHIKNNLPIFHEVVDGWNRMAGEHGGEKTTRVHYSRFNSDPHLDQTHLKTEHRYTEDGLKRLMDTPIARSTLLG